MGRKQTVQRDYDDEGNLISKECSCCHKIKPVSEFNKAKREPDGYRYECKECRKEYIKEYNKRYYEDNKEYDKRYYEDNKEYIKEYNKQYREDNKENIKKKKKQYYDRKTQEALENTKAVVKSNPGEYDHIEGEEIYGIIYLVHNIKSDRYYVGQTTRAFDNRYPSGWLYEHGRKKDVKPDLKLYGENSFEYIKLFKVAHSQYELDKLEAYYIDYYNSYTNGYNENRGYIFTKRGLENERVNI